MQLAWLREISTLSLFNKMHFRNLVLKETFRLSSYSISYRRVQHKVGM